MPTLTIIRGVSGSGKTTLAYKIGYPLCEADDFFYDETGKYVFDPTKLKDAHEWCRRGVESYMQDGVNVTVANTFTRRWEYAPYLTLADNYGYDVQIISVDGKFNNVHNVPEEVVKKQRDRFEY